MAMLLALNIVSGKYTSNRPLELGGGCLFY